ncbi:MAG: hypothetical protein WCS88_03050 [Patescibacteria group bacterium]|jgi:hypothetical protein
MPQTNNKSTQDSIIEIQQIYDLFVIKLNRLRQDKDKIVKAIAQRIDDQKIAEKLQELKDRY